MTLMLPNSPTSDEQPVLPGFFPLVGQLYVSVGVRVLQKARFFLQQANGRQVKSLLPTLSLKQTNFSV